jgi:nitrogen fixation protein FixH
MHMLSRRLRLVLVTLTAAACGGQESAPSGPSALAVTAAAPTGRILGIAPSSRDFGAVALGRSVTQLFEVTNTGDRATSALAVALQADTPFRIASGADRCTGLSLGKGRKCTVTVTFAPTSDGTFGGTLTVSSRTPAGAVASATLSGVGDGTRPTVTIDQADGQDDPTTSDVITFTVRFSEPVIGFEGGDVTLGGTAGASAIAVSGSGSLYTVQVSGMTQSGTVRASIAANGAADAVGNGNVASTSTDNEVSWSAATAAASIAADLSVAGGQVLARCTVRDASSQPVSGVIVSLQLSAPDEAYGGDQTTGATGTVSATAPLVEGNYTLTCRAGALSDFALLSNVGG